MFPSSNRTTTDNTLLTRTQTFSATEWLVNFHQNHGFQSPTGWILQVRYQNRSKSVKNQIPFQLRKQDVASFKLYQVLCIKALHMKARETIHYKRTVTDTRCSVESSNHPPQIKTYGFNYLFFYFWSDSRGTPCQRSHHRNSSMSFTCQVFQSLIDMTNGREVV